MSSASVAPSLRPLAAWYFFYFAFIGAFLPYFGLYLHSLGMSAERIALLMSLGQLMRLLAPPVWTWLARHWGESARRVFSSALAAALAFVIVFMTQDFVLLVLGLGLMHFFWSAGLPMVEVLTFSRIAATPERYGRIRLWGSIGFIAAVGGTGLLLDHQPIVTLLWLSWALLLATALIAWRLRDATSASDFPNEPMSSLFALRQVRYLFAAGLFMTAAHGALYIFYSIHLDRHGYDRTVIGVLWSVGVLAEIGVFALWPRLAGRCSLRAILLACFALAALRFGLIGAGVTSLPTLFLAQMLHGFTFGAHHAATMAALHRWLRPSQLGGGQAFYGSVAYGAGGIGGGYLAGKMWADQGAMATFSASSILALVGLWLVWRGIPTDDDKSPVR